MRNFLLLPVVVVVAIALALWSRMPPVGDGGTGYSPVEANRVLDAITREPRPVGSPGNAKARDWLAGRFASLGLEVERQAGIGVRQANFDARRKGSVSVSPYENIIAVLPGRNRADKAVAIMAHVDSAPWANGASDDAAGVAAVLETARVLAAGPKPGRDVVFLVTDAEELGLVGAQEFFSRHRLAAKIGAVVNVEARGSKGRAFMFQTSQGNSGLIDLWADNAVEPTGNSLAGDVYRLLPNDTDLSVPLAKGIAGINAAYIDGLYDYHMPTDNIDNIDMAAMRHLGDFAVATTRALAMADKLPVQAGEAAYFDFFGLFVVRYPAWGGWLLLLSGVILLLMARVGRLGVGWRQAVGGTLSVLVLMAGVGAFSHVAANWAYGPGMIPFRERINEMDGALWIYVALASGAVLLARPRVAMWTGAVILMLLGALAAQIWLPGGAWLFDWGGLIGALFLFLAARFGVQSPMLLYGSGLVGGIWGALLLAGVIATYVSVAPETPAPVALIIPFAIALIAPVIMAFGDVRGSRLFGGGVVGVAALGALWFAVSVSFSPRHPRPGDLFHYSDLRTDESYWATGSTEKQLPRGSSAELSPTGFDNIKWRAVKAAPVPSVPPLIRVGTTGDRTTVSMSSTAAPRLMTMRVRPSADLGNVTVNGRSIRLPTGQATRISWRAETPNATLALAFDAPRNGNLAIDYLYAVGGLPTGSPPSGGPDTDWTLLNRTRVIGDSRRIELNRPGQSE
ncbi:MAG: M20/M25/M40 family metallo-hydrolase [Sphingomonadaceae bacterium]|nr:M20/M25/M40 family metallo-hydrolase [Sphingomonadaceae bacterium]